MNNFIEDQLTFLSNSLRNTVFSRDPETTNYHVLDDVDIYVLGAGGIGSNLIATLCKVSYVRKITVIDDDAVESHNLNRTSYRVKDIGKYKVSAIAEICAETNPLIEVNPVVGRIGDGGHGDESLIHSNNRILIFDCRDDAYNDYNDIKNKLFNGYSSIYFIRVAYDGESITLDSFPENNSVWTNTESGYTQNISHSVPSIYTSLLAIQAACARIQYHYKMVTTISSRNILFYTQIGNIVEKMRDNADDHSLHRFIANLIHLDKIDISYSEVLNALSEVIEKHTNINYPLSDSPISRFTGEVLTNCE